MHTRTHSSQLLVYIGAVFTALAVIALGLLAIVQASAALLQSSPQEKTVLEIQVETAREIRRALAVPVVIPPLPPITASLARDVRAVATAQVRKPARTAIPREALNAMAMDQSEATRPAQHVYSAPDRHAISF
jgi:hypothetical protein